MLSRRKRRDVSAVVHPTGELREFVYLDEVSVISLLASRKGAIEEKTTEALNQASTSELSSDISAGAPLLSAKLGTRFQDSRSRSTEIVRQAVVQSQFKLLYESELANLAVRNSTEPSPQQRFASLDELVGDLDGLFDTGVVIDPLRLRRGQLIEVNIELAPDSFFAFSSAVSSMADLVKDHVETFGIGREDFRTVSALNDVLDTLLVGLVPIEARMVDFVLLRLSERDLIVKRDLLDGIDLSGNTVCDIAVAAVTERELYWKDIRQLLFSGSPYTGLCRVKAHELRSSWNSVKMLDVIGDFAADVKTGLEDAVGSFAGSTESESEDEATATDSEVRRAALLHFADEIAAAYGIESAHRVLEAAGIPSEADCDVTLDPPAQWEAFDRVAIALIGDEAEDADRARILEWRTRAIATSTSADVSRTDSAVSAEAPEAKMFLECEIVAVYW